MAFSANSTGRGIRVSAVSPRPIATSLHDKLGLDEAGIAPLVAQIPACRRGDPAEIAQGALFLVADEATFTVDR